MLRPGSGSPPLFFFFFSPFLPSVLVCGTLFLFTANLSLARLSPSSRSSAANNFSLTGVRGIIRSQGTGEFLPALWPQEERWGLARDLFWKAARSGTEPCCGSFMRRPGRLESLSLKRFCFVFSLSLCLRDTRVGRKMQGKCVLLLTIRDLCGERTAKKSCDLGDPWHCRNLTTSNCAACRTDGKIIRRLLLFLGRDKREFYYLWGTLLVDYIICLILSV